MLFGCFGLGPMEIAILGVLAVFLVGTVVIVMLFASRSGRGAGPDLAEENRRLRERLDELEDENRRLRKGVGDGAGAP